MSTVALVATVALIPTVAIGTLQHETSPVGLLATRTFLLGSAFLSRCLTLRRFARLLTLSLQLLLLTCPIRVALGRNLRRQAHSDCRSGREGHQPA